MPIVVRELIVRARVEEAGSTAVRSGTPDHISDQQIERLVSECVERTLKALKRNKER